MDDKSITIGLPGTSWAIAPSLLSYHMCDTIVKYRQIDDDPSTVYLCPYCESIYDKYQSNCNNCGAPLMMKPIRRCE